MHLNKRHFSSFTVEVNLKSFKWKSLIICIFFHIIHQIDFQLSFLCIFLGVPCTCLHDLVELRACLDKNRFCFGEENETEDLACHDFPGNKPGMVKGS